MLNFSFQAVRLFKDKAIALSHSWRVWQQGGEEEVDIQISPKHGQILGKNNGPKFQVSNVGIKGQMVWKGVTVTGEISINWVWLWERCQDKFRLEVKVAQHNQFGRLEARTQIRFEGQGLTQGSIFTLAQALQCWFRFLWVELWPGMSFAFRSDSTLPGWMAATSIGKESR